MADAKIKMDTDQLRIAVNDLDSHQIIPLQDSINLLLNQVPLLIQNHPNCDSYREKILDYSNFDLQTYAIPLKEKLIESRDRLKAIIELFEHIDGASADELAALEAQYPGLLDNPDIAAYLILGMTEDQIKLFLAYANVFNPDSLLELGLLVTALNAVDPSILAAPFSDDPEALLDVLVMLFDPGHPEATRPLEDRLAELINQEYGVEFDGKWPSGTRIMAAAAIIDVGKKFAESGIEGSGADAFRKVYGTGPNDHLQLVWGSTNTSEGGITLSDRRIEFASISGMTDLQKKDWKKAFIEGRNNVIHELGHAFCSRWVGTDPKKGAFGIPESEPDQILGKLFSEDYALAQDMNSDQGYFGHTAGNKSPDAWRQHPNFYGQDTVILHAEHFADMYLAWVEDQWPPPMEDTIIDEKTGATDRNVEIGQERKEYMDENMPAWLQEATHLP